MAQRTLMRLGYLGPAGTFSEEAARAALRQAAGPDPMPSAERLVGMFSGVGHPDLVKHVFGARLNPLG